MVNKNILIVGTGVSGLTTALKLLERGFNVTLWSKEALGVHAHTSTNAYAMWVPVRIDGDPRIERWANESFAEFEKLAADPATGVVMRQIFVLKPEHCEPWYANSFANFRHARTEEISAEYADAHVLDMAPVIDPSTYLNWLRTKVVTAGAIVQQQIASSLNTCPPQFDVVINCAGIGARELAADSGVLPERVQVMTVKANGFEKVVIDDEGPNKRACIVPHRDYIKLGATFDGTHESLEVDDQATQDILERCRRMVPGFKVTSEDVLSVVRAIRPERALPRVEIDSQKDGRLLVHNYGHDGMGYILSHGIAAEIALYIQP